MKKISFWYLSFITIAASEIPQAPEIPVESSEVTQKKVPARPVQKPELSVGKINLHDVMIFLDKTEKASTKAISSEFSLALCQQSYPIIVTSHLLKIFKESQEKEIVAIRVASTLFDAEPKGWRVYKTGVGDFYLFIPEAYLKNQNIDVAGTGFNVGSLTPIKSLAQENFIGQSGSDTQVKIDTLKIMFFPTQVDVNGLWNIFLLGHGLYPKSLKASDDVVFFASRKRSPIAQEKFADAWVCGMALDTYRDLIQFFTKNITTNFLCYSSCYAGGVNSFLAYLTNILNDKGRLTANSDPNFVIAALSSTDNVTFAKVTKLRASCIDCYKPTPKPSENLACMRGIPQNKMPSNFTTFFDALHKYTRKDFAKATIFSDAQLKEILGALEVRERIQYEEHEGEAVGDPIGIVSLPQVMFPRTEMFRIVDLDGKIGVISDVLALSAQIAKKPIVMEDKEAILVYPEIIQSPCDFGTGNAGLLSMIPGIVMHRFEGGIKLTSRGIKVGEDLESFLRCFFPTANIWQKYFYIKDLTVRLPARKRGLTYIDAEPDFGTLQDVLIGIKGENLDFLCTDKNGEIYYGRFERDDALWASPKLVGAMATGVNSNAFINVLANYFGPLASNTIKSNFDYPTLLKCLSPEEQQVLEKGAKAVDSKQLSPDAIKIYIGDLAQKFPNLKDDPNRLNAEGKSPLHVAAATGLANSLAPLVAMGANMNVLDKDGNTPLMLAIINKQAECVSFLVEKGANLTIKNKAGQSALDLAKASNDAKLLEKVDILVPFIWEFPAIHTDPEERALKRALDLKLLRPAQYLIQLGVKVDDPEYGILERACRAGDKQIVQLVMDSYHDTAQLQKAIQSLPEEVKRNPEIKKVLEDFQINMARRADGQRFAAQLEKFLNGLNVFAPHATATLAEHKFEVSELLGALNMAINTKKITFEGLKKAMQTSTLLTPAELTSVIVTKDLANLLSKKVNPEPVSSPKQ